MRHLNGETLARLVDEPASPEEEKHLRSCAECADELRAMREQTKALGTLPEIRPPSGDWSELETRLREEGLIREQEPARGRSGLPLPGRGWLQIAAALLLFLTGTGVGVVVSQGTGPGSESRQAAAPDEETDVRSVRTVDEAAEALRSAEERYVDAVIHYRELLGGSGEGPDVSTDAASRFAAIETLMAASRAAIREAPTDPFLNGVLASTMAERQAVLRRMSASNEEEWF